MPKIFWVALAIIVIILVVLFVGGGSDEVNDTLVEDSEETTNLEEEVSGLEASPEISDVGFEVDEPVDTTEVGQTHLVSYTEDGYVPKELTVALGDTVIFEDNSSKKMWTATAQHPTHTVYNDSHNTSLCSENIGMENIFDQCEVGESFAFTFNKLGEWGYHNHVSPRDFGKIIVIE